MEEQRMPVDVNIIMRRKCRLRVPKLLVIRDCKCNKMYINQERLDVCDKAARFANGFYALDSILLHNAINYIITSIFLHRVTLP